MNVNTANLGLLTVISGPSGVGKGTIIKALLKKDSTFNLSISATTRSPRSGEINGRDYMFFSHDEFKKIISNGELIEYAEYCGNYYGTLLSSVQDGLKNGHCLILEIEIIGFLKLKKKFPNELVPNFTSIFISPPSLAELERRLKNRGKDDDLTIKSRILKAEKEINYSDQYDLVIVNTDVETCVEKIYNYLRSFKATRN